MKCVDCGKMWDDRELKDDKVAELEAIIAGMVQGVDRVKEMIVEALRIAMKHVPKYSNDWEVIYEAAKAYQAENGGEKG